MSEPTDALGEAVARAREELERIREIRSILGRVAAETECEHEYVLQPEGERFCIGCGRAL
jgi:hypothetical protein